MSVFVSEVACTFDFHLREETQNETHTILFPLAGHLNNTNIPQGLKSLKYNLEPGNGKPWRDANVILSSGLSCAP